MITLESIVKGKEAAPLVVVVNGAEAVGKTRFACQADGVMLLDFEKGAAEYDVQKIPLCGKSVTYSDAMESLRLIYANHKKLGIKTVVVDSIDWFEKLTHRHLCEKHGVASIEEFKWGKGYIEAASLAQDFINGLDSLRELGMDIIIISHSAVVKVDEPNLDVYECYDLKLNRLVRNTIKEWATMVAYCCFETRTSLKGEKFGKSVYRAITTGERLMHTIPQSGFVAKSRIPIPSPLPLDWKILKEEISKSRKGESL